MLNPGAESEERGGGKFWENASKRGTLNFLKRQHNWRLNVWYLSKLLAKDSAGTS